MHDEELDDLGAALRRERATSLLLPLFFVSGATGLAYQTLWARQLHLVFGTSTFAIATVLAAFMLGLAIGGFLMARTVDVAPRPLRTYGWLEVGIGVYAVVFPALLALVTPLYLGLWQWLEPGPVAFAVVQFLLVGSLLLLPTAAMGATLPLLARFATDRLAAAGDRVGTLYAVNTAGAVFGTWLCGFWLLPLAGLTLTTAVAALSNVALGVAALYLDQWAEPAHKAAAAADLPPVALGSAGVVVATVAGLAGFSSLVYEVAWTRVLGLMLGASVYAFSIMLLAFLVGIATGGWLGGRLADRVLGRFGVPGVLVALGVVQVGVGTLSWGLRFLFTELPFWYVGLYDALGGDGSPLLVWSASSVLAVAVMTPPAVLMGVAFPLAVRAVVQRKDALGGPVGRIYGMNTLGSVLGAALAGFVLLPTLWIDGTVALAAGVNLLAAALAIGWAVRSTPAAAKWLAVPALGALVVAAPLAWPVSEAQRAERQLLLTAAMYKYVSSFSDHSREGIRDYTVGRYELLFYDEGPASVVTVARNLTSKNIWLANNGKVEASTTVDMPTQVLVSLLPFVYADDPSEVLVIGLASGITAGAVTTVPDVERIEVVELEPAILEAARYFDEPNHHVLDDPRTEIVINDGRNHVLLAEPGSFDVIISEPSNPWISGVSNLFTHEFLTVGRSRLREGGVWAQWVQMYGMDDDDLASLLATFADVYPHVALFMTVEDADLVMVGSDQPLDPSPERVQAMLDRWPEAAAELRGVGIERPIDLVALWQMGRQRVLEMTAEAPLNTDDNMRIEYNAPLQLHASTASRNVRMLLKHTEIPAQHVDDLALLELAQRYLARDDFDRSLLTVLAMLRRRSPGGDVDTAIAAAEAAFADEDWLGAIQATLVAFSALQRDAALPEELTRARQLWARGMAAYIEGGEPAVEMGFVDPASDDEAVDEDDSDDASAERPRPDVTVTRTPGGEAPAPPP